MNDGHGHVTPRADGLKARCGGPALCVQCAQEAATAGYREAMGEPPPTLTCPACGHRFTPPAEAVRVTESVDAPQRTGEAAKVVDGIAYADPGYQKDKKPRYKIDTKVHAKAGWSYINQSDNQKFYTASQLAKVKATIKAALKRFGVTVSATEAFISGKRTFDEVKDLVRDALTARARQDSGALYVWVYIADLTDTDVVYTCADLDDLMQCSYSVGDDESVTLGDPVEVVRTYAPADTVRNPPPEDDAMGGAAAAGDDVLESDRGRCTNEAVRDRLVGRVVEAKGTDDAGGRIFRVRIIAYGDSKNGRRYPADVMREAVSLYDGAKAFDHHRSDEELRAGSLTGLIGSYRGVEAEADGIYGDLHLLPSATHAAEALDASLEAQEAGLPPLAGISHDVKAHFTQIVEDGRRLQEATQIVDVMSGDVVSTPAAGGKAVRAVAGGEDPTDSDPAATGADGDRTKESDVPPTKADVLAALKEATDDELAGVGLSRSGTKTTEPTKTTKTTESTGAAPQKTTETAPAYGKESWLAKQMVKEKVSDASLPAAAVEAILSALPGERITEASVDAQIASMKAGLALVERADLAPNFAGAKVTRESHDKKISALDAFFDGDFSKGYRSFKEAYVDFSGRYPRAFDVDFNKQIMRETVAPYDSDGRIRAGTRTTESMDTTSWDVVLGDSVTRRMISLYGEPSLQTWRQVVSDIVPVQDFRTQRRQRIGGYGVLPVVNQGQPYQPLSSPTDEEAVYAVIKRGGTEDITLEMIANDDVGAIRNVPRLLGIAAAITLYRFVFDTFVTNAATTYDSTALFHASHNNTASSALSRTALSAGRKAMRKQSAYGDSTNVLSIVPRTLIVPSDLEELAFELCTSAVAIPTSAPDGGASNIPNIHQGMSYITVDYYSSTTGWYLACEPMMCPTIEIGFYLGREDPELFTQSDPNFGTVFNADKITYKIRHGYSGTPLEHRGFYRGNS